MKINMVSKKAQLEKFLLNYCLKNKTITNESIFALLDNYDFKDKDKAYEAIISYLENHDIEIIEGSQITPISNKRVYDSQSGLQYYLQGEANVPPLSKEEELRLGKLIFEGKNLANSSQNLANPELKQKIDAAKDARDMLARSNLKLVVSVAKNFIYTKASFDDMVSEGYVGLVTAIDKYDYRKGYKFSTYATYWIRQAIGQYIKKSGYAIRVPISMQEKINKVKQAQAELLLDTGRNVSYKEIADKLGKPYDEEIVKQCLIYASQTVISLDATQKGKGKGGDEHDLYDVVSNNEPGLMALSDEKEEISSIINKGLKAITPKEEDILKKYYGINCDPMTLGEIGKLYNGVTKERIRQIKDLALKKIKRYLKNN